MSPLFGRRGRGRGARSQRRRLFVWLLVDVAVLIVLAGLAVLVSNLVIALSARSSMVDRADEAPQAQVAIVLGAKVYPNGGLSPMLTDRLETGVLLYKLGKVDKLLLSSDHGQTTYDEVNAMLRYALERGVPEEDVFTDHAGFNTYDTMYRARDVFEVTTALVVTQRFHLARAVYTARSLGLEAIGVPADIQPYASERRFAMRDWLARVKAFFQLHVTKPEPRYLGAAIPIDGDGRATRG
ncbi:MAG: ElyC/SanA/YdcF family protein [bacterium]